MKRKIQVRMVGGFRSTADLETFGMKLKEEGFHVDSKPFGISKYLEVSSGNLKVELYLRETYVPQEYGELSAKDKRLIEIIKAKYPYEGIPKYQPPCGS